MNNVIRAANPFWASCALLESSTAKPLATDHIDGVQALTIKAERRTAFVDSDWIWWVDDLARLDIKNKVKKKSRVNAHHYCADPAPDVVTDVVQRFLLDASGKANLTATENAEVALELGNTTTKNLNKDHGARLFKDGVSAYQCLRCSDSQRYAPSNPNLTTSD